MLHTATPRRASAYGEQGNVYLIAVVLVAVRYRRGGGQHADTQRLMCTSLEAAVSVLPLAIIPSCTIVTAKIMRILFTTKKQCVALPCITSQAVLAAAAITERTARMAVEAGAKEDHEGTHHAATLGRERGAGHQDVDPRPLPEERAMGGCPPEGGRSKG